jgi:hypothetical protein
MVNGGTVVGKFYNPRKTQEKSRGHGGEGGIRTHGTVTVQRFSRPLRANGAAYRIARSRCK